MVFAELFWINSLPAAYGISDTISPQSMLTVTKLRFSHHHLLKFGDYFHTHKDGYNSMEDCIIYALAL